MTNCLILYARKVGEVGMSMEWISVKERLPENHDEVLGDADLDHVVQGVLGLLVGDEAVLGLVGAGEEIDDVVALSAVLVEQYNMVTGFQSSKQCLALGDLLLSLAHLARALHITDILDIELHIVLQAFDIFLYALPNETNLGFANNGECYLHFFTSFLSFIATKLANPPKYP